MATERDLTKHFEAILGRPLDIDLDGSITLRARVGISTRELEGSIASREIGTTGASTKGCTSSWVLDVSGFARTSADGTVEFLLSDFHCRELGFAYPVNLVATPRARSPVYLTYVGAVTSGWKDVKITVYAWDATGTPAPHTPFDWRCRVPVLPIVE